MKTFRNVIALMLVLVLAAFAVACDEKKPAETTGTTAATTAAPTTEAPTTEAPTTEKKPVAPAGYQMYKEDKFGFAYPEDWTKTTQSGVVMLMNSTGAGNNVTVSYEPYSDLYSEMTLESFNRDLKPALEQAGLAISNASVEQTESEFDVPLTKIVYTATVSGVEMKQTVVVFALGDRNYCITVTETHPHAALVENILATLHLVEE